MTWTNNSIADPPGEILDDVGSSRLKADNTTGSTKKQGQSDIATIVEQTKTLAATSPAADTNDMSDEQWNARIDNNFKMSQPRSFARLRTRLDTMPKIVSQGDGGTTTLMGPKLGTPQPVAEHTDRQRWKEEEQKLLEQAEKKRDATKYQAVLDKIAELEKQPAEDNHEACEAKIAGVNQQVAKKADKAQVDEQRRAFASFGSRISKVEDDNARLEQQYNDLSEKLALIEWSQNAMKTANDANTQTVKELRGRIHVLENPLPVRQVSITNLGAVATAIASTEQPEANTAGCDPKDVSALTTKTEGHDQRLDCLETAIGDFDQDMMHKASEWFEWAGDKFKAHDEYFKKVGEIVGSQEQQVLVLNEALAKADESFKEKLRQQKEDSDKELSDCKESMEEQMRLQEASIRKEYEERLATKDKEFAEHVARTDAEQKQQNQRHDDLKKTVDEILARLNAPNAALQSPSPGQGPQPPESHPLQPAPAPAPQGNGPWSSAPTPPAQGQPPSSPEVHMGDAQDRDGVIDLDSEMEDAPTQPPQPPQQHRPQPSHADTPMAFGDPMTPNNNGNVGVVPKPQPRRGVQPFVMAGPAQPPVQAPVPPAAPTQGHQNPVSSNRGGIRPFVMTGPAQPPSQAPVPNNNGNMGAVPKPQPMAGIRPFVITGPAQPPVQAPVPPAAPAQGHFRPVSGNPITTGTGPSNSAPFPRSTPTERRGEQVHRSLFGSVAGGPKMPVGQMQLPDPMATPAKAPAPSNFDFNTPAPAVNKPQINWSASMEKLNFEPPADMDIDEDVKPSMLMARQPLANAAPPAPLAGQPAVNNAPSGNFSGPAPVMNNGTSSTTGGPSSTPARPQTPAPTTPAASQPAAPKHAKKKADPFVRRKPNATPSKPMETTSKAQATQTKAASFAEKRQAAFAAEFGSAPERKATLETTPGPSKDSSAFHIPGLTGAVNTSPYALKKEAPAPASMPVASPLANHAATSDTIEAPTTTNVFMQEVEYASEGNGTSAPEEAKPAENVDDIQMSGEESKPEAPKAHKHESDVNPRKHTAEVQIVPQDVGKVHRGESQKDAKAHKPEAQDDAKPFKEESPDDATANQQNSRGDDLMETDHRPMAKAKGKASKLTEAQIQSTKARFTEEQAWASVEQAFVWEQFAAQAKAAEAAAASAGDKLDYGDPNDMNDEDVHNTTMVPPTPKVRHTKYSIDLFQNWKQCLLSRDNLEDIAERFDFKGRIQLRYFIDDMVEADNNYTMHDLLREAKIPVTKEAFSKYEMDQLITFYREEVFLEAIREMELGDDYEPQFDVTRAGIVFDTTRWFESHHPDTP